MFVGLYFGLIIKKNMRNILFTLMISISLFSCNMDNDYYVIEKHENKVVKSVIYHPTGYDNTLQTTPYWEISFANEPISIRSNKCYEVGDTIDVIVKIVKKYEKINKR